mmetsp:Transcript_46723/g.60037  ORF Transcript_46723/g.60037 Transcript_46723/m.60037 type:complete len:134 (-) Transcript_46723:187-588(-)
MQNWIRVMSSLPVNLRSWSAHHALSPVPSEGPPKGFESLVAEPSGRVGVFTWLGLGLGLLPRFLLEASSQPSEVGGLRMDAGRSETGLGCDGGGVGRTGVGVGADGVGALLLRPGPHTPLAAGAGALDARAAQ